MPSSCSRFRRNSKNWNHKPEQHTPLGSGGETVSEVSPFSLTKIGEGSGGVDKLIFFNPLCISANLDGVAKRQWSCPHPQAELGVAPAIVTSVDSPKTLLQRVACQKREGCTEKPLSGIQRSAEVDSHEAPRTPSKRGHEVLHTTSMENEAYCGGARKQEAVK